MATKQKASIRQLWGLAKSKELGLTDDELHEIVYHYTGKASIKELNQKELQICVIALSSLKDLANKKRKDYRGGESTENQIKKIRKLAEELGWKGRSRLSGMCKRMFKKDAVEWLDYTECSKLIEALKAMAKRKEKADEGL